MPKVKCAVFLTDFPQDAPNHKELEAYLGKGTVLYGGDKRKSKNTPFIDKTHLLNSAISKFEDLLMPTIKSNGHRKYTSLYMFDSSVYDTHLLLKYAAEVAMLFEIDEQDIDELHKLEWHYSTFTRSALEVEAQNHTVEFILDRGMDDTKLSKHFAAFTKSNTKFVNELEKAADRRFQAAAKILGSGWKS